MGDWWNPFGSDKKQIDYMSLAQGQAQADTNATNAQTQANRPNQSTPWASLNWTQGPDGQWTQSAGFNGGLGQFANGQMDLLGQRGAFDWSQFGGLDDGSAAGAQGRDAYYAQGASRLDPQFAQREEALRAQLVNQGLDPSSEAGRSELDTFGRARNDAYGSLWRDAAVTGQNIGSQTFGNNLQARQQKIAEALKAYGMPLEQLQALQSFLQMPGYAQAGKGGVPNFLGAAGLQSADENSDDDRKIQMITELIKGGAAAGVAAASDERVKEGVVRLDAEAYPGVPAALFRYRGGSQTYLGVIAQDVERVAPWAVVERHGVKHVRYGALEAAHG